jgi:hypothetical protein
MPTDWDRVVLLLYKTFAVTGPAGRRAAGRLLELAYARGLFQPPDLNDLSVQLLILVCESNSPLNTAALQELISRNLHLPTQQPQAAQALREATFRDDRSLLRISWSGDPQARAVLFRFVVSEYERPLHGFLTRLFLLDSHDPRLTAGIPGLLIRAWGHFAQGIPNRPDYPSWLFAEALRQLSSSSVGWTVPHAWPVRPPGWQANLSVLERQFIDSCLNRSLTDRCLIYLSTYSPLNLTQIRNVLEMAAPSLSFGGPAATVRDTRRALERAWTRVLRSL